MTMHVCVNKKLPHKSIYIHICMSIVGPGGGHTFLHTHRKKHNELRQREDGGGGGGRFGGQGDRSYKEKSVS